mgnify:CR=1 FL=1
MIRRRETILLLLVALAATSLITLLGANAAEARERYASSVRSSGEALDQVRVITELRQAQPRIARAEHPTQDVIADVNRVLDSVGLDAAVLRSLSPQRDESIESTDATGGTGGGSDMYRRQVMRLSLAGLTPGELGAFLMAWRDAEPLWKITRLEMTHPRNLRPNDSTAGRYDVALDLTAIYVDAQSTTTGEGIAQ